MCDRTYFALPGEEFVAGGGGEKGYGGGGGLERAVEAVDGFWAFDFGVEQGLLGFAEDYYRGTALAGGDAETGGETDGLVGYTEGQAEDVLAEALGQHDGADGAAAGEGDEEFVFAGTAEEVVAAQETRGAADHLAEEFVTGVGAEARVPMAEVVDIEEDHAKRGFSALDAVGFAEEHGEDGFAVVDAGEAVDLGVEDDGFAERVEFQRAAAGELDLIDAETPVSGFGGSRDEVVDYAFGEAVGEFLGDGVGDEEDGEGGGGAGAGVG
jgi:hypothetical protein